MNMEENLNFVESCQTIALPKKDTFISAFPGKIVFGEINHCGFKYNKCFIFFYYEVIDLYLSILQIITFFSTHSESTEEKGTVITKSFELVYYWIGKTVTIDECEQKVVKIGIQYKDEIAYELILTSTDLNNLILCLPQVIFSSLCLKSVERRSIEFASEQSTSIVASLNDINKCKKFIQEKLDIDCVVESNIIDLFLYYHELILIIHKLKSLFNKKMKKSNIEKNLK